MPNNDQARSNAEVSIDGLRSDQENLEHNDNEQQILDIYQLGARYTPHTSRHVSFFQLPSGARYQDAGISLGAGCHGEVRQFIRMDVLDDDPRRRLAVKTLRFSSRTEVPRRVKREIKLTSTANDDDAPVYGFFWENQARITEPFISGKTLAACCKDRRITQTIHDQFAYIIMECARELDKLHQKGLVHGDVKETNVMIKSNPFIVRWIDYGLSSYTGKPATCTVDPCNYFAPERIKADSLLLSNPNQDTYSLSSMIVRLSNFFNTPVNETIFFDWCERAQNICPEKRPGISELIDLICNHLTKIRRCYFGFSGSESLCVGLPELSRQLPKESPLWFVADLMVIRICDLAFGYRDDTNIFELAINQVSRYFKMDPKQLEKLALEHEAFHHLLEGANLIPKPKTEMEAPCVLQM